MEEQFQEFKDSVNERIIGVERNLQTVIQKLDISSGFVNSPREGCFSVNDHPERSHVLAPGTAALTATGSNSDIQGDFSALKDSLARIKLPTELRLNESRQGIKRSDVPVLNILSKCSRYSETTAKLLSTIEPGSSVTQETLDQLFLICHAQCKYVQDEYAAILVNGQFDQSTSRIFRALQKNTSGLNADSLDTLRSAATLSAASRTTAPARGASTSSYESGRGGYRGGQRGGRRGDVFNSFASRQFPSSRYRNSHQKDEGAPNTYDKDD